MIGDAITPLKKACYQALTANSTLMSTITGIFDMQVPTDQSFPFVTMGPATQNRTMNTLGKAGRDCTIMFHTFTQRSMGSAQSNAISNMLVSTLAQANLPLSAFPAQTCVFVDLDNYTDQLIDDDITFHAIIRMLFMVQEV